MTGRGKWPPWAGVSEPPPEHPPPSSRLAGTVRPPSPVDRPHGSSGVSHRRAKSPASVFIHACDQMKL
eukprot:gene21075-1163_t